MQQCNFKFQFFQRVTAISIRVKKVIFDLYLGLTKSSKSIKQKYKDKQIFFILFYQTLRIMATIVNTKFDPFQQSLKGFYNYFYEKNLAALYIAWNNHVSYIYSVELRSIVSLS